MDKAIQFTVHGHASPQGSKQGHAPLYRKGPAAGYVVRRHKNACPGSKSPEAARKAAMKPCMCPAMVTEVEDDFGSRLKPWRREVEGAAIHAMKDAGFAEDDQVVPFDGLVCVTMEFFWARPKTHYGTGKNERLLKDSAPAAPGKAPDLGKQARAIQDAMTKIVYLDDSKIVSEVHVKRYVHAWEREYVVVTVAPAKRQTVGDLVAAGIVELPTPEHLDDGQLALDLVAAA